MRPLACILGLSVALGAVACAKPRPTQPPGAPPTPKSVTRHNPGGDAADPELAALERLIKEPWGFKRDRFNTMRVPLSDWTHWQRVRLFGYPTRAAYRFGDDHFGAVAVWYRDAEPGKDTPDACLAKFIGEVTPVAEAYGIRVADAKEIRTTQLVGGEARPLLIRSLEGSVESLLESNEYVGALASYTSWPGTCLIHGFTVVATNHRELARKIRDRWVTEGAPRLVWEKKVQSAPPTLAR
jgi:hypothetical protein